MDYFPDMFPGIAFIEISTWEPEFVAALRRHYTGSRGAPPGKKLAWRILEDGRERGYIGLGEPAFKLAPRRRLGIEDAMPMPMTVSNFIFRLESGGREKASTILRAWHGVATAAWDRRYGWAPVHWETLIDSTKVRGPVIGACYRRAGYRHVGRTTGRGARRPPGSTHGPRVWEDGTPKEFFYRGPLRRRR